MLDFENKSQTVGQLRKIDRRAILYRDSRKILEIDDELLRVSFGVAFDVVSSPT